jgi:serine O-acetyltransferase
MIRNAKELISYIKADLFRYHTSSSLTSFFRAWFIPGFRYTFWMRVCNYAKFNNNYFLFIIARILNRHYQFKYGILIPYQTKIGKGLYIGHFTGIVINSEAVIGENVNISQGLTIGRTNGGNNSGVATIGDRCYFAAGSKVIGNCQIGNDCVIGANAVVTKDIPDGGVAVGVPAKVISYAGSSAYVGSFK